MSCAISPTVPILPLRRSTCMPCTIERTARCQFHAQASSSQYRVHTASNSAELRSVASLRARIFFDAAEASCSQLAAQSMVRMKANSIWDYLEDATGLQRLPGKDEPDSPAVAQLREEVDLSCMLPSKEGTPSIVVGSLDLTIELSPACHAHAGVGPRLGGEQLAGQLPCGSKASSARAYLCNVSVARAMRRKGVASAMIELAHQYAGHMGVAYLYVHAAVDNASAIHLYQNHCGFDIEQAESADIARGLNRPKRILLRKAVTGHDPEKS